MGKKFMGLDGTNHFWDRAKAWILNQITSAGMDKQSVIDAVYPVGSLYWSSKDTDPSTLFGGTWVQIKDRFVLACGDTYTSSGATGGASSVTLSVSNMPSHDHTFTPSGKITMDSHSHGLNNHTHSFSGTTGGMSANATGRFTSSNNGICVSVSGESATPDNTSGCISAKRTAVWGGNAAGNGRWIGFLDNATINVSHTHSFSGTTGSNSGNTTSTTSTGSFSGTQGTTSSNGSGTAFNILPPYVVKYCWERTA